LAIVVKKPGADVDQEGIKALLMDYADKGIISKYGVPDRVKFVDALPRTSVGKLDKKVMRAELAD
jgi:fatty-acyl-CoA synthase